METTRAYAATAVNKLGIRRAIFSMARYPEAREACLAAVYRALMEGKTRVEIEVVALSNKRNAKSRHVRVGSWE